MIKSLKHHFKQKILLGKIDPIILWKKIEPYHFVSFDLFDTLIKRDLDTPEDIYKLTALYYKKLHGLSVKDFSGKRKQAYFTAFKKSLERYGISREITLDEIYNNLPYSLDLSSKLMECEKSLEVQLCRPNPPIVSLVNKCIDMGKEVAIISNMYLPKETIIQVLENVGLAGINLYLSSDIGVRKHEGNLFKVALSKNNANPKNWVHIGDSYKADYLGALSADIKCILIPQYISNTHFQVTPLLDIPKDKFTLKQVLSFINNTTNIQNTIGLTNSLYQAFGYEIMGPMIFDFIHWLHYSLKCDGFNQVFFFSREGYFLKQAFDLLYSDIKTNYLYVSRRALRVPFIHLSSKLSDVISEIIKTRTVSLKSFIDSLGLQALDYVNIINDFDLRLDTRIWTKTAENDERFQKLYHFIAPEVIRNSEEQYENLSKYLIEHEFTGRVACVDIGWSGGMQYFLQKCFPEININGYYFGTHNIRNGVKNVKSYCDMSNENYGYAILSSINLLELFCFSNEGSCAGYKNYNGKILPVLLDYEYDQNKDKIIRECQSGSLRFLNYFKLSPLSLLDLSPIISTFPYTKTVGRPTAKIVELFAKFPLFDFGEIFNLCDPEMTLFMYIFHLDKFKNDLLTSRWKAGFLKKLFKLPLPWGKIIVKLKKFI
jgi:predicted HAD superfamily hydrolase